MKANKLIELEQRGYLNKGSLLQGLPGLHATHPSLLAGLVSEYLNLPSNQNIPQPIDKGALGKIAREFHSMAGTLTASVLNKIELAVNNAPLLRLSHQPIMLPYLGIMGQFIFMDTMAQHLLQQHGFEVCSVYQIVDYDVITEKRLRVSHFPSVKSGSTSLSISIPPPLHSYEILNLKVEKPTRERIEQWFKKLDSLIVQDLTVLRRSGIHEKSPGQIYARLRHLKSEIWEAHTRASNLSEFNAIFLSRMVNLYWNLPIIFFPASCAMPLMQQHFEFLLQRYPDLTRLSNEVIDSLQAAEIEIPESLRPQTAILPFWYVCQHCSVRVRLNCSSVKPLISEGACPKCRVPYRFNLGSFSNPKLGQISSRIIPRVFFQDLIDIIGLRYVGGVGYMGNSEHMIVSGMVSAQLGLDLPPEHLWRPYGIFYGLSECMAALVLSREENRNSHLKAEEVLKFIFEGRASGLYYILSQGAEGLLRMWRRHFEEGKKTYETNIGEGQFWLPSELTSIIKQKMSYQ